MSLTLYHLLGQIRQRLDDEGGDRPLDANGRPAWVEDDLPCLWSNRELFFFLLDTVREIGIRNPLQDDRVLFSLAAARRLYRVPEYVLTLDRLHRDSDGEPLARTNLREMEHIDRDYRAQRNYLADDGRRNDRTADWRETVTDEPTHYLTDERKGFISFYPVPRYPCKIRACVHRTYILDDICWPQALCEEVPEEFPDYLVMRDAIVAGVCARAYRKRDSDTNDQQLADRNELEFIQRVGPMRSLKTLQAAADWAGHSVKIEPRTRFY